MARSDIVPKSWPGFKIPAPADLAAPAAYHFDMDPISSGDGNGGQWDAGGGDIIVVEPGTANPTECKVLSVATRSLNRDEPLVINWTSGDSTHIVIGPIPTDGFKQTDGKIYFDADEVCNVAVFRKG